MIDTMSKEKCTGCKMCGDICPKNAIQFVTDSEGFWYPQIDNEKCNQCGLCERRCPSLHPENIGQGSKVEVYAAWSRKSAVREESTSGGIFWEVATTFVEEGGAVVGTKWNADCRSAEFCVAQNIEDLKKIRGSKYIQSDTEGIYKKVSELVLSGSKVLFCGTPCQNAALKSYLNGKDENVYYFDFICRSINSPKALDAYVTDMERQHNSKVVFIRQKSKKRGWQSLATNLAFDNGEEILLDKDEDLWVKGFIQNDLYTRNSCFECLYRTLPRKCADISVGDFWEVNDVSSYDLYRGISVVIVNNKRGEQLFQKIKDNIIYEKRTIEETLCGNTALLKNPINNGKKRAFFEYLSDCGFIQSVEKIIGRKENIELSPEQELERDRKKYENNGVIDGELYIYLNFQCKNIVRNGKAKFIPYENTVIDMKNDSHITLEGDKDFEIEINLLRGSKIETLIRVGRNANIYLSHGGCFFYGTTLDVKDNAIFSAGYFSANTGTVFVVAKGIFLGEDVMIGRNVLVYDSDFHQILDENGKQLNKPEEVYIGDHVWLTSNINVNKGVNIKEGSIIANQTVVNKDISEYSLVAGQSNGRILKNDVRWSRNAVRKYENEMKNRKIILYGFGIEGKKFYARHREKISIIIDNNQKTEKNITFEEFKKRYTDIVENSDEWIAVIAAPNYYDYLYQQLRNYLPELLIVPFSEV